MHPKSGFQIAPNWPYIEKIAMASQFSDRRHRQIFLTLFFFLSSSLVTSCYWPEFHVNIITGSRVMAISFCKRLTRNPEIGNTPV